jgi:hypothetical protein
MFKGQMVCKNSFTVHLICWKVRSANTSKCNIYTGLVGITKSKVLQIFDSVIDLRDQGQHWLVGNLGMLVCLSGNRLGSPFASSIVVVQDQKRAWQARGQRTFPKLIVCSALHRLSHGNNATAVDMPVYMQSLMPENISGQA